MSLIRRRTIGRLAPGSLLSTGPVSVTPGNSTTSSVRQRHGPLPSAETWGCVDEPVSCPVHVYTCVDFCVSAQCAPVFARKQVCFVSVVASRQQRLQSSRFHWPPSPRVIDRPRRLSTSPASPSSPGPSACRDVTAAAATAATVV